MDTTDTDNALTVPANLIAGAMGTMSDIHDYFNRDERYSGLDPNSMGNQLNVYSGAVRGQTQQNIVGTDEERAAQVEALVAKGYGRGEAEFYVNAGRQGLGMLYRAGMSAADTGARALAGGALGAAAGAGTAFSSVGAVISGMNTFTDTMANASARGATPEQALKLAVTTAGIEALTEKVPLDNLIKVSKGGGSASLIKNILRQAGIEATEEEVGTVEILDIVVALVEMIIQVVTTIRTDQQTAENVSLTSATAYSGSWFTPFRCISSGTFSFGRLLLGTFLFRRFQPVPDGGLALGLVTAAIIDMTIIPNSG